MMDREDIIEDIYNCYPKATFDLFGSYIGIVNTSRLNKRDLTTEIVTSLENPVLFKRFTDNLTPGGRQVLYYLTWYGITTLECIEKFYSINLSNGDFYGNSNDPFIKSIKPYNQRELFLSTGFRELFKLNLDPPKGYKLELKESVSGEVLSRDSLTDIAGDFSYFLIEEGMNSFPVEKKIPKKTIRKFINRYNLEDRGSGTLLKVINLYNKNLSTLEDFKKLISSYSSGTLDQEFNIDELLFYPDLRGVGENYAIRTFLKRGRYSVISLLKDIDSRKWVSVSNLILSLAFKEDTEIFDTSYFGSSIYNKGEKSKPLINKIDLCFSYIEPLLLGILNLLYILGGIDITLDDSDSIDWIRINSYGNRLFGRSRISSHEKEESNFDYNFLSSETIITTNGIKDPIFDLLLRIGERIGDRDIIITPVSFFKNINSESEININLKRLKDLVNCKDRDKWDKLFDSIESRIEPLYNEQQSIIVNLPLENREFVELVLENPKLKDLFSLVEGGRVVFTAPDYKKFKKELKSLGYFLS